MPYDTLRRPTTPAIPAHDDPSLPYYTCLPRHPHSYHPCTPSILLDLLDPLDLLLLFALDLAVS